MMMMMIMIIIIIIIIIVNIGQYIGVIQCKML